MQNHLKFQQRLYLQYYQLIEFFNQIQFGASVILILIWLPNFVVFLDVITTLMHNLGLTQILVTLITQNSATIHFFQALILIVLITPLFMLIFLLVKAFEQSNNLGQNQRNYSIIYEQSSILRGIKLYFKTYKQISFPILLSFSMKILKIQSDQASIIGLGVITVILLFINLILMIYYDLEIGKENSGYQKKNYKASLIDFVIVGITIIVINVADSFVGCIIGSVLYFLSLLFSIKIQNFNHGYETHRKLSCSIIILTFICLLLGKVLSQRNMMIIVWIVLILVLSLLRRKMSRQSLKQSQQQSLSLLDGQNEQDYTITTLKYQLWQQQKFIQTFQNLIKLSRQKNSHREQLTIQILKSKCYKKQIINSGGSKILNPIDLFRYETQISIVIEIIMELIDTSEEIFKVMKEKQTYKNVFILKIMANRKLLQKAKYELEKALKINGREPRGLYLLHLLCKNLQDDHEYLKMKYQEFRQQILSHIQLKAQQKLFSENVALIVINVMQQIGKITQMTNNITGILGYKSHHLVNLPINGLMPFTIRQIHDEVLTKFINNFDCRTQRKNPKISSYAYNKDFQLQKVSVEYKFMMNDFETLSLSGILQKIYTEETLILTDEKGNIEGWNKEAGELLKLEEISGSSCKNYNILPFLPALIKYQEEQYSCNTLLFRPSKAKNPKLCVQSNMKSWDNIKQKQIEAFQSLLEDEQIIDIFYVELEIRTVKYLKGKSANKFIEIKKHRQVQNIQQILTKVQSKNGPASLQPPTHNNIFKAKTFTEQSSEYSLIDSNKQQKVMDLNFSLSFASQNIKLYSSDIQISRQIFSSYTFVSNKSIFKNTDNNNNFQDQNKQKQIGLTTNTKPKLKKQIKGFITIIVCTIFFLCILFYDQISLLQIYSQLAFKVEELKKLGMIEMIVAKSVFNPNQTYIEQFKVGNLMLKNDNLKEYNFQFTVENNQPKILYNYFYLLNVHIPSMLDSLITIQDESRHSFYRNQLLENIKKMVEMFIEIEQKQSKQWASVITLQKAISIVIVIIISLGTIGFSVYIILIKYKESIRMKTIQGFFKFQKTDLDIMIQKIHDLNGNLREKIVEWNIQFPQEPKKGQSLNAKIKQNKRHKTFTSQILTKGKQENLDSKLLKLPKEDNGDKNPLKEVLKIAQDNKLQKKVPQEENRSYVGLIGVVVFVLFQLVFIIIYGIMNSETLDRAVQIFQDIKYADKLLIYPNLQMAQLFVDIPTSVSQTSRAQLDATIQLDANRLPDLYTLLEQAPCINCTYLSQILKTNYRSFYSYFTKAIQIKIESSDQSNLQQLFYAVDLVNSKIFQAIRVPTLPLLILTILVYIASLILFYFTLIRAIQQIEEYTHNLQTLLKYFDNQTINKNKHLNAIFDRND